MEAKTVKFQMMLEPSIAEAVDDWSFTNRVRTRAEAIRRLIKAGLETENPETKKGAQLTA
jgi:metal-responsive CopG/Arc/MetJ family transcriptional regulator